MTTLAPAPARHDDAALLAGHALLRGTDPATGRVGTWHLAPGAEGVVVTHVSGHITSDAVWMQTAKTTTPATPDEVAALLGRVERCC